MLIEASLFLCWICDPCCVGCSANKALHEGVVQVAKANGSRGIVGKVGFAQMAAALLEAHYA